MINSRDRGSSFLVTNKNIKAKERGRPPLQIDVPLLLKLRREGLSFRRIAQSVKSVTNKCISYQTVRRRLK